MATLSPPAVSVAVAPPATLADVVERLGNVPLTRVRVRPPPGAATEADVLEAHGRDNRLVELVDGVLVEKPTGYREPLLAVFIARMLDAFIRPRNLGLVSGADGMMRLFPGLVRIPDVAYASWSCFPERRVPAAPIPDLAPDLVVEILSEGNTEAEMSRKRREYFAAGVRLVWIVDPQTRTVRAFMSAEQFTALDQSQTLDAGEVLPGFQLSLRELFGELDRHGVA